MIEGFFHAHFVTDKDQGDGVAYLANGKLHGGDSAMFYRGTYSTDGEKFEADLEVGRHTEGTPITSITGAARARHKITGRIEGDNLVCEAVTDQEPAVKLDLTLTPIS
ncbi:GrlR family regulatory protein [Falsirhodobacter deserti]|uniref:GrlR family regulatory protein n=1 Tax=Falsirhodobacter deserti TaxID=1365611 RepID=UPI000FE30C83|nr:GrlR family regulatory protein [Falsirhodobacter deserti]